MADSPVDVLIVGGGIVGASLACALAQTTSLRILVVEAGGATKQYVGQDFDPRVVALSEASRTFLQKVGAWETIVQQRACPYFTMDVWDAEGTGRVLFDCADNHQPNLGHIVENTVVVRALQSVMASSAQIDFRQNARLVDYSEGVAFIQEGDQRQSIACDLLVAADGAKSSLRFKMGLSTREWDYQQQAIVCTVQTEEAHGFACRQRFTSSGPIAFLPLCIAPHSQSGKEYFSSLVWSLDDHLSSPIMSLNDSEFCRQLSKDFEYSLGAVTAASKRYAFPLRQRHALDYVQPGFALIGDAAHTIHPLAGQGVNLGIADVVVLAEEIQRACTRSIPLADFSILQRYQRRRKTHNLATMAAMEGFKRLFGSDDIALRWLRNRGMNLFNRQHWLKNKLSQMAAGQA